MQTFLLQIFLTTPPTIQLKFYGQLRDNKGNQIYILEP